MPLTVFQKKKKITELRSQILSEEITLEDIPSEFRSSIRSIFQEDEKWYHQLRRELKDNRISLIDLPPKFWFFSRIDLSDCALKTLDGFPSSLDHVTFINLKDNHLQTLEGLPAQFSHLSALELSNNPLISLRGLPDSLPSLLRIRANDLTQLSTLEGFPLSAPKLRQISFRNNRLLSLKGLPSQLPSLQKISFGTSLDPVKSKIPTAYPLRTLSYIAKPILRYLIHHISDPCDWLTSAGNDLFTAVQRALNHDGFMEDAEYERVMHHLNEYYCDPRNLAKPKDEPDPEVDALQARYARDPAEKRRSLATIDTAFEELWAYYATTPEELTVRYCNASTSLSPEEYRRLVHELDHTDRALLASRLSASDSIFSALQASRQFRLNADYSIL